MPGLLTFKLTLFTNSYKTNRIQATYSPLLNGIWALAMVATAWFGARQILNGLKPATGLAHTPVWPANVSTPTVASNQL